MSHTLNRLIGWTGISHWGWVVCVVLLGFFSAAHAEEGIVFTATASEPRASTALEETIHGWVKQFEALENAHDPALAKLYSPQAVIQVHRGGETNGTTETLPGSEYQALLNQAMDLARVAQENQYYVVRQVIPEGKNQVWVIAERHDMLRSQVRPIAWRLQKPASKNQWLILQEVADL